MRSGIGGTSSVAFLTQLAGLGVGAVVALVLLAYPLWFTLAGPAHLSGRVWPTLTAGVGGITPSGLWHLRFSTATPALPASSAATWGRRYRRISISAWASSWRSQEVSFSGGAIGGCGCSAGWGRSAS